MTGHGAITIDVPSGILLVGSHRAGPPPHHRRCPRRRNSTGGSLMGAALKAHAAWLVNALGIGRNPLRRPIDRLAAGLTLMLLMVAMIAVPVSAMFADSTHRDLSERAEQAARTSRPVTAVVVAPPS